MCDGGGDDGLPAAREGSSADDQYVEPEHGDQRRSGAHGVEGRSYEPPDPPSQIGSAAWREGGGVAAFLLRRSSDRGSSADDQYVEPEHGDQRRSGARGVEGRSYEPPDPPY